MKYYKCNACGKIEGVEVEVYVRKCKFCSSDDIVFVTKDFIEFYEQKEYKNNVKKLLKKAKDYLKKKDYENAYCFANMSNLDNELSYDAFVTKLLATYKAKDIESLTSAKQYIQENEDFKQALKLASKAQTTKLNKAAKENEEKITKEKYKEANKLLKSSDIIDLSLACRIFASIEDYKDSKKKLALCREEYKRRCEMFEDNRKKAENTKSKAALSIILVIIVMVLLILFCC